MVIKFECQLKRGKKMKKRKLSIFYVCILTAILLILSACTGRDGKVSGGSIGSNSDEINGEYSKFTGSYFREIDLPKGTKWEFKFKTDTNKGAAIGRIETKKGKVVAVLDDQENTAEIEATKDITYRVYVYAKDHGGKVKLSWGKVK